jgi:hypothetical protein
MVVAPGGELLKTHIGEIVESHIETILGVFEQLEAGEIGSGFIREPGAGLSHSRLVALAHPCALRHKCIPAQKAAPTVAPTNYSVPSQFLRYLLRKGLELLLSSANWL